MYTPKSDFVERRTRLAASRLFHRSVRLSDAPLLMSPSLPREYNHSSAPYGSANRRSNDVLSLQQKHIYHGVPGQPWTWDLSDFRSCRSTFSKPIAQRRCQWIEIYRRDGGLPASCQRHV